jgi:hypothetical protein
MGSRPYRVGEWELEYDHLGTRLVKVGQYAVGYDRLSRPLTVGQMLFGYKGIGSRPRTLRAPGELSSDDLLAVFVVLQRSEVLRLRRRGGSAGAMQA